MKAQLLSGQPSSGSGGESPRRRPIRNYALWIVQGLLALIFLFTGGMKLVMPLDHSPALFTNGDGATGGGALRQDPPATRDYRS